MIAGRAGQMALIDEIEDRFSLDEFFDERVNVVGVEARSMEPQVPDPAPDGCEVLLNLTVDGANGGLNLVVR